MSKRKPKWAKSVKHAMIKKCKHLDSCMFQYKGIIKDTQGNILRIISCEDGCSFKY